MQAVLDDAMMWVAQAESGLQNTPKSKDPPVSCAQVSQKMKEVEKAVKKGLSAGAQPPATAPQTGPLIRAARARSPVRSGNSGRGCIPLI